MWQSSRVRESSHRRRALSDHSKSTCAALIHGRKRLRCGESVIGEDRAAHRRKMGGEPEEVVVHWRRGEGVVALVIGARAGAPSRLFPPPTAIRARAARLECA